MVEDVLIETSLFRVMGNGHRNGVKVQYACSDPESLDGIASGSLHYTEKSAQMVREICICGVADETETNAALRDFCNLHHLDLMPLKHLSTWSRNCTTDVVDGGGLAKGIGEDLEKPIAESIMEEMGF